MSIEDLFISSTFPAIHDLGKLPVVAQQLHNICDVQLVGEEEYYRYSPSLCVSWLKTRVERASKSRALLLFRSSREGSFSHRCSPSHFVVHQHGVAAGDLQRVLSGAVAAGAQVCCGEGVWCRPEQTQSESKASVKRRHSGKSASQAKKGKSSVSITSFFKVKWWCLQQTENSYYNAWEAVPLSSLERSSCFCSNRFSIFSSFGLRVIETPRAYWGAFLKSTSTIVMLSFEFRCRQRSKRSDKATSTDTDDS